MAASVQLPAAPLPESRSDEANIERPAWRAASVADEPIAALLAAGAQVMPADGLGVAGESRRESSPAVIKRVIAALRHQAASRSATPMSAIALDQARKHLSSFVADGNEEPQLPGDDLAEEAKRAQPIAHALGEAGELDAIVVHDARATQLHAHRPAQHAGALDDGAPCVAGADRRRVLLAEISDESAESAAGEITRPMMRSPSSV